jgi:hypothetical protein
MRVRQNAFNGDGARTAGSTANHGGQLSHGQTCACVKHFGPQNTRACCRSNPNVVPFYKHNLKTVSLVTLGAGSARGDEVPSSTVVKILRCEKDATPSRNYYGRKNEPNTALLARPRGPIIPASKFAALLARQIAA